MKLTLTQQCTSHRQGSSLSQGFMLIISTTFLDQVSRSNPRSSPETKRFMGISIAIDQRYMKIKQVQVGKRFHGQSITYTVRECTIKTIKRAKLKRKTRHNSSIKATYWFGKLLGDGGSCGWRVQRHSHEQQADCVLIGEYK